MDRFRTDASYKGYENAFRKHPDVDADFARATDLLEGTNLRNTMQSHQLIDYLPHSTPIINALTFW